MSDKDEQQIGIPEDMRIKRRYTMSDEALEQRRKAAKQPKPGMLGKRNNWRHGSYAQNFLTKIKPCLSSCTNYPCRLVDEGATEPGGDCLDAEELLHIIRVVHKALMEPGAQDELKEISATVLANNIHILSMMQEDIIRDGTVLKSIKKGKYGDHVEFKLHPSLFALPRMISDLGLNLEQFMLTPKVREQLKTDKDAARGISEMFKTVGGQLSQARSKKDDPGSD